MNDTALNQQKNLNLRAIASAFKKLESGLKNYNEEFTNRVEFERITPIPGEEEEYQNNVEIYKQNINIAKDDIVVAVRRLIRLKKLLEASLMSTIQKRSGQYHEKLSGDREDIEEATLKRGRDLKQKRTTEEKIQILINKNLFRLVKAQSIEKTQTDLLQLMERLKVEILTLHELKRLSPKFLPEEIDPKIQTSVTLGTLQKYVNSLANELEKKEKFETSISEEAKAHDIIARAIESEVSKAIDVGTRSVLTIIDPKAYEKTGAFTRWVLKPLIESFVELYDALRNIKKGAENIYNHNTGYRTLGDGLLRSTAILGTAAVIGYGVAVGIITLGIVIALGNPFSLMGGAAIAGLIVVGSFAGRILKKVADWSKQVSNKLIDKDRENYQPSDALIREMGEKNAEFISTFFRNEIDNIKKAHREATSQEEQNTHMQVLVILQDTWEAVKKADPCYQQTWKKALEQIHKVYQDHYNHILGGHIKSLSKKIGSDKMMPVPEIIRSRVLMLSKVEKMKKTFEKLEQLRGKKIDNKRR